MTQSWSADLAWLSTGLRFNVLGTGSASVTVHGSSMGLVSYTGRAREGQTGCEATEWESETSVRGRAGLGAQGSRRVLMTVGQRHMSISIALSTDLSTLSLLRFMNGAGTGSASVTVHGSHLGLVAYSLRALQGVTGCESTEWESESALRCRMGHGTRSTLQVVMTIGDKVGSITQAWSLDLSRGALSITRQVNRAGTGSALVTLHGARMGLMSTTILGRQGGTSYEITDWWSETSVRCQWAGGYRSSRRIQITGATCLT